jgi:predicted ATPase
MAITKVELENFTVFENAKFEFCEGVNVLIGENGTGKTHLMKVLHTGNTMFSSKFTYNINDLFGNRFKTTKGYRFIINNNDSYPWVLKCLAAPQGLTLSEPDYIHMNIGEKKPSVFIPSKEVLSMSNITRVAEEYKKTLNLDITLTDIIEKAQNMIPDNIPPFALEISKKIENHIEGKVFFDEKDKTFWIDKSSGKKIPFTSEAEGFRKLGLLWQLIMNKSIKEDTILFWDEPEANINPNNIPFIVDILFELQRNGVQIFIATHSYDVARWFELSSADGDNLKYFNLKKTDNGVECTATAENYKSLSDSVIENASDKLYNAVMLKMSGEHGDG